MKNVSSGTILGEKIDTFYYLLCLLFGMNSNFLKYKEISFKVFGMASLIYVRQIF